MFTVCFLVQLMKESTPETITTPPKIQKLERLKTIEKEHKDALERAVSLNIPHAVTDPVEEAETPEADAAQPSLEESQDTPESKSTSGGGRTNWDHVIEKLFKKSGSGDPISKKDGENAAITPP